MLIFVPILSINWNFKVVTAAVKFFYLANQNNFFLSVILQIYSGKPINGKPEAESVNMKCYFRNLDSLRYGNEYCKYGKIRFSPSLKPFSITQL